MTPPPLPEDMQRAAELVGTWMVVDNGDLFGPSLKHRIAHALSAVRAEERIKAALSLLAAHREAREALRRWDALATHLSECETCTDGDGACEHAFEELAACRDAGKAALSRLGFREGE